MTPAIFILRVLISADMSDSVKQKAPIQCPLFYRVFNFICRALVEVKFYNAGRVSYLQCLLLNLHSGMIPKGSRCTVYMLSHDTKTKAPSKSSERAFFNVH